jgi:hypothetical protein
MKGGLIAIVVGLAASAGAPMSLALTPPVKNPPPLLDCVRIPSGARVCSEKEEKDWSYIDPQAWRQAWRYIQLASREARSSRQLTFKVKCGPYSGDRCLKDSRAFLIDPTRHPVWQARNEPCREPAEGRRCIAVRFGNQCVGQSLDIATRADRAPRLEWVEIGFYACPHDPGPPPPMPIIAP